MPITAASPRARHSGTAECGVTKIGADDGIRTRDPHLGNK